MWVRCAAVQVTRADCATPRPPTPHAPAIVHGFAPNPDIISGAAAISDYIHQLQVTQAVGVCAQSPLTTVAEHAKAAAACQRARAHARVAGPARPGQVRRDTPLVKMPQRLVLQRANSCGESGQYF